MNLFKRYTSNVLCVFVIIFISVFSSSCSKQQEKSIPDLELIDAHFESTQYARYISGSVKNNSSKKYSYAQISFNLYDGNGNQVGSPFDNISGLEPGITWKFKALVLEDNGSSFKLSELTGY